jgi:hypothetical protein
MLFSGHPWSYRPGPQQRAGVSGSWPGDAEEDEGRVASRALWRSAAAMLRQPWRHRMAMARLRRLAMARGAVPVRTFEASSAKVVSRMWCNASMPQWPRT